MPFDFVATSCLSGWIIKGRKDNLELITEVPLKQILSACSDLAFLINHAAEQEVELLDKAHQT